MSAKNTALESNLAYPRGHKFYMGLCRENLASLPVFNHKALAYQILHVALSSGLLPRVTKL